MRGARFRIMAAATAATALTLASEPASAQVQETFDIEIANNGQPAANVEVLMLVNRAKTPLGTTNTDGNIAVDMSLINIPKSTEIEVYEIECDDVIVVVFVAPGEREALEEECERRRRENPECECRRIGAFAWGDDVTIDIGTRTVTSRPTGPTPEVGVADLFTVGVTFGASYWPDFEDTAALATGATATDATRFSPTLGAYLEWGFPRTGLRVGIGGHYSRLQADAVFGGQPQTGEIDYYDLGLFGRWEFGEDQSRTLPYLTGGGFYSWNRGDFELAGVTDRRDQESWRGSLGAGVVHWFSPNFGVWGEGIWSPPAGDQDADEHVRFQVGPAFRPFWDACGGSCIR